MKRPQEEILKIFNKKCQSGLPSTTIQWIRGDIPVLKISNLNGTGST